MNLKNLLLYSAFIGFLMMLILSQRTAADLSDEERVSQNLFSVATLDLQNQNTATHQELGALFQISNLQPTGFQVASVRIANQGSTDIPIQIQAVGQDNQPLCQNLHLTVLEPWKVLYEGPIGNYVAQYDLVVKGTKDLVFSISLPVSDNSLQQQSCNFAFVIKSTLSTEMAAVYDEEVLQNQIVAGTW